MSSAPASRRAASSSPCAPYAPPSRRTPRAACRSPAAAPRGPESAALAPEKSGAKGSGGAERRKHDTLYCQEQVRWCGSGDRRALNERRATVASLPATWHGRRAPRPGAHARWQATLRGQRACDAMAAWPHIAGFSSRASAIADRLQCHFHQSSSNQKPKTCALLLAACRDQPPKGNTSQRVA